MYLSKIHIKNFRGIKDMEVCFHKKLNVIIGANASNKTSLIDAIRMFYGWGDPDCDLDVTKEDFYRIVETRGDGSEEEFKTDVISIDYEFKGLSIEQKGAYYQYLVVENGETSARVGIEYKLTEKGRVFRTYYTGKREANQKADYDTFQMFKAYYLGALRDSTRSLMSTKFNLLGQVIKRKVNRNNTEDAIKQIVKNANDSLLQQQEVTETKDGINDNLSQIQRSNPQQVDLQIAQNSVEYIVNVIKPFIPISTDTSIDGYPIWKNSLGYNNLIYIATVLSDIRDAHMDDANSICALFIEEPEAHLHPQLQINLYNFLKGADTNENAQTFITTHSPTLTSRIPFESLILLDGNKSYCIGDCFNERETEKIVRDVKKHTLITNDLTKEYKDMLVRYLDVTRSQLLFSKGALLVEGISEALLMNTFSKLMSKPLTDNEVEMVDTEGTAFYQFLMLFNSSIDTKRLPIKAAFLTDADQFTDSKKEEYNLDKLIENNYTKLETLKTNIQTGSPIGRVANMTSMCNGQGGVLVKAGDKTLEFQIAYANMPETKTLLHDNNLYKFLNSILSDKVSRVDAYIDSLGHEVMTDIERYKAALLMWKCMPEKSKFAQKLSAHLEDNHNNADFNFTVPQYIQDAINFLIP